MSATHTLIASLISNEAEDVSGRTKAEIERVLYVRVKNFDFLERATGAERQEQWSVKVAKTEENAGSGSIRVRKVTNLREPGAAVQYVLTSKLDIGKAGSAAETSEQSTLDQFNVFKYMANKGMLKDRYTFPIEGSDLYWEVDCFPKPGEMYFEWVKIDLESWPRDKELPQLPMAFSEMLEGTEGEQTEDGKAKISQLYQDVFLIANTKAPLAQYASEQPEVAPDTTGATGTQGNDSPDDTGNNGDDGDDANKTPDDDASNDGDDKDKKKPKDEDGQGKENDPGKNKDDGDDSGDNADGKDAGFADGLGDATKEAFSSAGQLLMPFIPILGPLITVIHGERGMNVGGYQTKQHTETTIAKIDGNGRKTTQVHDTGSYDLHDLADAKDFIGVIERAVSEVKQKKSKIEDITLTLWPQRDGRFGLVNIRTNRNGETKVFTENNPGQLKWFNLSLAGKRLIKLNGEDVARFNFNNRSISCPFDGRIVEFDVGQLRQLKYSTKPSSNHEFEIVEFNFDR